MTHFTDMKHTFLTLMLAAAALLGVTACHEGPINPDPETDVTFTFGAYFLNAGATGQSEITQLNTLYGVITPHCFSLANDGKTFGNGGCDIHIVGNKMYATLASSKRVNVIDKNNCKDLGSFTISADDGSLLTPSHLADFEGMLIVSLAEGYVASIDTVSYSVRQLQKIDGAAGCMAVANQKLYVANPDGETIQMLNPVDLHIMKTLEVGENPRSFTVGSDKKLYLVAGTTTTSLLQIDSDTEEVTTVTVPGKPIIAAAGPDNSLIVYVSDSADELGGRFYLLSLEQLKVEAEFIRDGSYVKDPTGLFIDLNTGNVYISQDGNGDFAIIYIYASYGQFITSFDTGTARTVGAAFVTSK